MRSNMREALMRSTVVASSIRLHPRFGHTFGHKKKYNCILIHTPSHRPHIVKVMGLDALEYAREALIRSLVVAFSIRSHHRFGHLRSQEEVELHPHTHTLT